MSNSAVNRSLEKATPHDYYPEKPSEGLLSLTIRWDQDEVLCKGEGNIDCASWIQLSTTNCLSCTKFYYSSDDAQFPKVFFENPTACYALHILPISPITTSNLINWTFSTVPDRFVHATEQSPYPFRAPYCDDACTYHSSLPTRGQVHS